MDITKEKVDLAFSNWAAGTWEIGPLVVEVNKSNQYTIEFLEDQPDGKFILRRYSGGILRFTKEFDNYVQNGQYIGFDSSGQKEVLFEYKAGKKHGKQVGWKDGRVKMESGWRKGKRHGKEVCYDINGKVTDMRHYKNGQRHGLCFYREQNANTIIRYHNGFPKEQISLWRSYKGIAKKYIEEARTLYVSGLADINKKGQIVLVDKPDRQDYVKFKNKNLNDCIYVEKIKWT